MKYDFKFRNGEEVKEGETTKPDSLWMDEQSLEKISDGLAHKIQPKDTGEPSFISSNAKMSTPK